MLPDAIVTERINAMERELNQAVREAMKRLLASGTSQEVAATTLLRKITAKINEPQPMEMEIFKEKFPFMTDHQVFFSLVVRDELEKIRMKKPDVVSAMKKLLFRIQKESKPNPHKIRKLHAKIEESLQKLKTESKPSLLCKKRRRQRAVFDVRTKKPKV